MTVLSHAVLLCGESCSQRKRVRDIGASVQNLFRPSGAGFGNVKFLHVFATWHAVQIRHSNMVAFDPFLHRHFVSQARIRRQCVPKHLKVDGGPLQQQCDMFCLSCHQVVSRGGGQNSWQQVEVTTACMPKASWDVWTLLDVRYATEAQKVRLKKLFKRYGTCKSNTLFFSHVSWITAVFIELVSEHEFHVILNIFGKWVICFHIIRKLSVK